VQAQRGVAVQGPGGVARQDVDFTGLQHGKTLRGVQGGPFDLVGIAQHGGGHGLAHVHVQTGPVALAVRSGKAGQAGVDAAVQGAARLDGVERFASECRGDHRAHHSQQRCRQQWTLNQGADKFHG
jgi:hypothetical protein